MTTGLRSAQSGLGLRKPLSFSGATGPGLLPGPQSGGPQHCLQTGTLPTPWAPISGQADAQCSVLRGCPGVVSWVRPALVPAVCTAVPWEKAGAPAPGWREALPGLTSFLVACLPAHALHPRTPGQTPSRPSVPWGRCSGGGAPREGPLLLVPAPGTAHPLCPQLTCVSALYGAFWAVSCCLGHSGGEASPPLIRPAQALPPLVQGTEGLWA